MKVILRDEVDNLGQNGDVVDVADGYGRNYLLPKGLAVKATPKNLKQLQKEIQAREEQKKEEQEVARKLALKLGEVTVVVRAKAGEKGRLFGSVTNSEIASRLEEDHGITIDRRKIDLKDPIKEVGFYTINVKLHQDVIAELKVQVEAEAAAEGQEKTKEQEAVIEEGVAAPEIEEKEEKSEEVQAQE